MTTLRVPPGRAGRLWVRHRLEVAERGAALLEQKLRALADEQRRLTAEARHNEAEWTARAREADTWLVRATVLGGQRGLRLARTDLPATVTVTWTTAMGVRFPADAHCTQPTEPAESATVAGSAALVAAQQAHRTALDAALHHAAATAAVHTVSAEVTLTRQRVRTLRRHWIPRLREAADRLELELEERERSEAVARRWAGTSR